MKRIVLLLGMLLCLLVAGNVLAGSSGNYRIDWLMPMSGSGGGASSANHAVSFTVGQSATGSSSSGDHEVCTGFWCQAIRALEVSISVILDGTGSGTVTSSPAGINCGSVCSNNFDHNTVVTLTAEADPGSTFTGWTGAGCSGTGNCVVTMDTDKTVTAVFAVDPLPGIYLPLIFSGW
jgi:hypothetical protein